MSKYSRILLKVSGELLSGEFDGGVDPKMVKWLADEIKPVVGAGVQVVIMVGGGNFARGAQLAGHGIRRVTADHMGMLGTMMNALAVTDIFEESGIATRCLSNIFANQVAEPFVHRLANKHLENGRVIILAGGTGRPFLTTDTAAVVLGLELDCEVILKATKVDGVYSDDPEKDPTAKLLPEVSFQEAVENPKIRVMDKAALGLAVDHQLPIVVFNLKQKDAIAELVAGKSVGTTID